MQKPRGIRQSWLKSQFVTLLHCQFMHTSVQLVGVICACDIACVIYVKLRGLWGTLDFPIRVTYCICQSLACVRSLFLQAKLRKGEYRLHI
jgi:hypothetical protein